MPTKIRYLVIDYDGCALHPLSLRHDLISLLLISHVEQKGNKADGDQNGYEGFYGCTHRARFNDYWSTFHMGRIRSYKAEYNELHKNDLNTVGQFDPDVLLTTQVTNNFSKAFQVIDDETKTEKQALKLIEVSTPDDCSSTAPNDPLKKCGYGYREILSPYEEVLKKQEKKGILIFDLKNKELKESGLEEKEKIHIPVTGCDKQTKNPQLLQIIQHAEAYTALQYPGQQVEIELDFFDDVLILCDNALKIDVNLIPKNISMNVYCHLDKDLQYIGRIKGTGTILSSSHSEEIKTDKQSLPTSTAIIFNSGLKNENFDVKSDNAILFDKNFLQDAQLLTRFHDTDEDEIPVINKVFGL